QLGHLDPGPTVYTYHPAIEIGANGEIGLSYEQSSAQQFLSMYVTGRLPGDEPGTMQAPVLAAAGVATVSFLGARFSGGTRVAPLTGSTSWAASAHARDPDGWYSWIAPFAVAPARGPGRPPPGSEDGPRRPGEGISLLLQPPADDG